MPRQKKWCSKRVFRGNKHTKGRIVTTVTSEVRTNLSPRSASEKKLSGHFEQFGQFNASTNNIILSLEILSSVIKSCVACKDCGSQVYLEEGIESRKGLACKLFIKCSHNDCKFSTEFWTSDYCKENNLFEVNCRLFYGLRCIGKGPEAGKMLCGMMNLPKPSTYVSKYTDTLKRFFSCCS